MLQCRVKYVDDYGREEHDDGVEEEEQEDEDDEGHGYVKFSMMSTKGTSKSGICARVMLVSLEEKLIAVVVIIVSTGSLPYNVLVCAPCSSCSNVYHCKECSVEFHYSGVGGEVSPVPSLYAPSSSSILYIIPIINTTIETLTGIHFVILILYESGFSRVPVGKVALSFCSEWRWGMRIYDRQV